MFPLKVKGSTASPYEGPLAALPLCEGPDYGGSTRSCFGPSLPPLLSCLRVLLTLPAHSDWGTASACHHGVERTGLQGLSQRKESLPP